MPDYAPPCGYWLAACLYCGWVVRYVLRYGDREQDRYWATVEDIGPVQAAALRARVLEDRMNVGLGPWPDALFQDGD